MIVEELPDVIDGDEDDFEQIPQSVLMQFIKELPDGYRTVSYTHLDVYKRQI